MIGAIFDRSGLLGTASAVSALERAGAVSTRSHRPLTIGWTDATVRVDPGGVVLLDGIASDAITGAFERLREGDASRLGALRGAFAGIAWSERRGSLAIARDHFGRRGLFVATRGQVTYIGSEIGPLLAMLPRRPEPDPLAAALWLGYQPLGRRTLYAGVSPLLPGHSAFVGVASDASRPYWSSTARSELGSLDAADAAEVLWETLRLVLTRQLAPFERPGVLLSGGLDSSAVLAAVASGAADKGAAAPPVFSAVFPDHPDADEGRYIGATAAYFGSTQTRHNAHIRSILSDAAEFLRRWHIPQDFPQRGFFHGALVAAAHAGIDVLLDGEAGDELFGADPFVIGDLVMRGRLLAAARIAREVPGMGDRVSLRAMRVVARKWIVGGLLSPSVRAAAGRHEGRQFLSDTLLPPIREMVLDNMAEADSRRLDGSPSQDRRRRLMVDRPRDYAAMDYLRRKCTMAQIEHDSPLFDPDLLVAVLGLPPGLAFHRHRDKEVLRRALAGRIPEAVRLRTDKTTFERLPIESLAGADKPALIALLDGTPPVGGYVDIAAVREDAHAGPERYRHGPTMWLMHMWRVATLAQWLRALES